MRFFPCEKEKTAFSKKNPRQRPFPLSRVGKNRISQGVENGGSLISVPVGSQGFFGFEELPATFSKSLGVARVRVRICETCDHFACFRHGWCSLGGVAASRRRLVDRQEHDPLSRALPLCNLHLPAMCRARARAAQLMTKSCEVRCTRLRVPPVALHLSASCRATRVAADFLDFTAFCRCSSGVAPHPLKILVSHLPPRPPIPGRCRTEIWV